MKVLLVCLMFVCLSWARSSRSARASSLSCNCGWRNAGRIVGGKETKKNEYPWMVSLSNGCGGSIITPWHVLTAGHCTVGVPAGRITVSVGRHYKYFGKNPPHMQQHSVARIIQHESYKEINYLPINDVSVLVLKTPIKFTQYVGPVCMPSSPTNLLGKFVKVIGWGLTKGTGDQDVLREVDVQVISNSDCKKSWPLTPTDTQLCAYTARKDSCNGDSGGPLVYLDPATNRFTQVALVSYGPVACGSDPRPSVNTDVFAFISWIKNAIAKSKPEVSFCTKV